MKFPPSVSQFLCGLRTFLSLDDSYVQFAPGVLYGTEMKQSQRLSWDRKIYLALNIFPLLVCRKYHLGFRHCDSRTVCIDEMNCEKGGYIFSCIIAVIPLYLCKIYERTSTILRSKIITPNVREYDLYSFIWISFHGILVMFQNFLHGIRYTK